MALRGFQDFRHLQESQQPHEQEPCFFRSPCLLLKAAAHRAAGHGSWCMAAHLLPQAQVLSDPTWAIRIDRGICAPESLQSHEAAAARQGTACGPLQGGGGWALRAPGCGGVRVTRTEAWPRSERPRLETGSLAALLAWVCGLAPSDPRQEALMASEGTHCAQVPPLDPPRRDPGLPSCLHRRSSGFCEMPQSPGGLLGQPFQEEAQPCAGSQASSHQRLGGS